MPDIASRLTKGVDRMPDAMAGSVSATRKGRRYVIYFIQAGHDGPIKIGCCRDLKSRLQTIQISCAEKLIVLGVMGGNKEKEKELHNMFSQYRKIGEWFDPSEELINFTNQLVKELPSEPSKKRRILAIDGVPNMIEVLAIELGVPSDTVRKWRQRGVPHHRRDDLREAAVKYGLPLSREAFDNFGRKNAA